MAKGGKRKGSGRKPTGKVAMLVRVSPEVRKRLEHDAKRARRSLSSEVERQLTDALRAAQSSYPQMRALCYLISQIPKVAKAVTTRAEYNWRTNYFDHVAFSVAVYEIVRWLWQGEMKEDPRKLDFRVPIQTGKDVAYALLMGLAAPSDELYSMGPAPRGSLIYALPQAARDLNLKIGWLTDQLRGVTKHDVGPLIALLRGGDE